MQSYRSPLTPCAGAYNGDWLGMRYDVDILDTDVLTGEDIFILVRIGKLDGGVRYIKAR